MKNILFVLRSYPNVGGIESVTTLLANFLSNYHKVQILSLQKDIEKQPGLKEEIQVFHFPSFSSNTNQEKQIDFYNFFIEKNKIDVVINQGCYDFISNVLFNSKSNKSLKIISALHGIPTYETIEKKDIKIERALKIRNFILRPFKLFIIQAGLNRSINKTKKNAIKNHRTVYQNSDYVVLLSKSYIKLYMDEYKISNDSKLKVIINPSNYTNYTKSYNLNHLNEKKKVVLYMGRLTDSDKRVDRLLDIWSKVSLENPEWTLKIVGDGQEKERLLDIASKKDLINIQFCNFTAYPESYYREASIVCLTSQIEGFPMALIEGVCFGVVPVAYNCSGGVADILTNNSCGVLVPAFNEKEYCESLTKLMRDDNLRKEKAEKCLIAKESYDIERIGQQWLSLIG